MLRHTCFALALTVIVLEAQTMSFFRQSTTPGIGGATTVAADASGIYVVGDRGVRKYDSSGNELWTREFSVPLLESARRVRAAANATGVYVVGWTDGETNRFVRKYGPGGEELWTRQLDFLPTGLGVDDTGVYVAGGVFAPFPNRGSVFRKYTAEGVELWTNRSRVRDLSPEYGVVDVDATGVYVFGGSSVGKWDPRGNELWIRQLGAFGALVAAAVPTGFYVVGNLEGRPFLRKYDDGGNELWTRQIATSSTGLYPGGVAADATGVYIAGTTDLAGPALPGQCRSGSGVDSFVRKYDPDGAELPRKARRIMPAEQAGERLLPAQGQPLQLLEHLTVDQGIGRPHSNTVAGSWIAGVRGKLAAKGERV